MGQSTDAILFFGILIDEDYEDEIDWKLSEWEDIYCKAKGNPNPEYEEKQKSQ